MSARGLIRSMMIIGSAQAINIALSILRMKVLAILLGPAGVGLLSIFNSFQSMVSSAAGLGMGSSGVRQIASVRGEEKALSQTRRVLLAAHIAQGAIAMLGVWFLRSHIARWLFGDTEYATEVGLVGIAIQFTLLSTAQTALLRGMRRIGDLGRVTVWGAFAGTVAGIIAVWFFGTAGLIWFVLVQPLATFIVAIRYIKKLPKPTTSHPSPAETWNLWLPMVRLGAAFMLGGLANTATLLVVRSKITQDLGLDAAGQFAASWGITMIYVGFLLRAMGADYYPRLAEVIDKREAANNLINDQLQLGLAIGGPILLLLIGWAPWIISLLYSTKFSAAGELLQWQTVGNVLKLASWPLAFSLPAAARGKTYLLVEVCFNILFMLLIWLSLDKLGILAAGPSFTLAYMCYFLIVAMIIRRIQRFRWQSLSLWLLIQHALLAFMLLALARYTPLIAIFASSILALITGIVGLRIILTKIGSTGRYTAPIALTFAAIGWPLRKA